MSVLSSIRVAFEDLKSVAFGSISGTYVGVGTPFAHPVRLMCIDNDTDANILVSFDGISDKTFVASNGFKLFDLGTNRSESGSTLELPAGTRVYVKQESGAPTAGTVYVTAIYASQS